MLIAFGGSQAVGVKSLVSVLILGYSHILATKNPGFVDYKRLTQTLLGTRFSARPRRYGVPRMRYNEFGKLTPNLFIKISVSLFFKSFC